MTACWDDPLYRPRTELPDDEVSSRRRFGPVEAAVSIVDTDPASYDAMYRPDRAITLTVLDSVTPAQLDEALPPFLSYAAQRADRPTQALLSLPSRDIERGLVARQHGIAPASIIAVTELPARAQRQPAGDEPAVTVREAHAGDADALARLWCEQTEYEALMGSLRYTPPIRDAIVGHVPETLAGPDTVLVAVRDGVVVSAVVAKTPADSAWAVTRLERSPASYLAMASTTRSARGSGAATAIVAELHRRQVDAGLAASILHYGVYNPLSVPFWSQRGYRPLITSFGRIVGRHD